MSERLKLVERFDELSAGVIVVVTCLACGGSHRDMLIGPIATATMARHPNGVAYHDTPRFQFVRLVPAHAPSKFCIDAATVAAKLVYRVDDSREQDTKTARPKTREVAR